MVMGVRACRENVIQVVRKSKLSLCYFYPRHRNSMLSQAVFLSVWVIIL